ncbi:MULTISPECIES: biotin--[acetyl-CoA-carboxylase] ligase [Burkholderiaceae]|uniref:biotin--[acetyl-CoA-carboxylase] ligase n=1 Tax=Burkholderia sp. b13 TaxID=1761774 RepID=UPI000964B586|nr:MULTISPECIES: biotin--[acetyl-CoA-carboxylase] ligase [Burkholderiaceae]SIT71784.1 BirA family transcriptional regulator, biotin operon repressor / biotin-[acetyl-CoA-carboxylase] ligase [Burkholderia sp. b13]
MSDPSSLQDSPGIPGETTASGDPRPAARHIERERLLELLDPWPSRWAIEVVYETGSTNADLAARLKKARGVPFEPSVRVAYSQTAGRGRRGRPWLATPGNALLFSLGYLMPRAPARLAGLSLALGAMIVDGLRTLPLDDSGRLSLKWPNDILLDGAKLAGVLVETVWSTRDATALVVGVGLNINGANELEQQIASLHETLRATLPTMPGALSRAWPHAALTPVLGAVLNALAVGLERFGRHGFEPFRDAWIAEHAYAGQEVVVLEQGDEMARGTAYGVDEQGQLLIRTPQAIRAIATGDVSLRLAASIDAPAQPAPGSSTCGAGTGALPTAAVSTAGLRPSGLPPGGVPASDAPAPALPGAGKPPATGCAREQQPHNDDA